MVIRPDRWEQGSEFHAVEISSEDGTSAAPWASGLLLGSGRDALRSLARHGLKARRWRKVWVPAYLCQEVVAALVREGLPVRVYPDLPGRPLQLPAVTAGDALLVVNTFGLRARHALDLPRGVDLVEDHTHDPTSPWATRSVADFAVASLRKSLPIPDGGALWSPSGHPLPGLVEVTPVRRLAAAAKRAAMELKTKYLAGEPIEKAQYRALALKGEAGMASGQVSAITEETRAQLASFPFHWWRAKRRANFNFMQARLMALAGISVLQPEAEDCVPFSVPFTFERLDARERVRGGLAERRVYPAILWPLEEAICPIPDDAIDFSRRMISLHCDGRYDRTDLELVLAILEELLAS